VGVDGDCVPPAARDDGFVAGDLELPLELGRRFDLAISMEVAEHLSPASAERFVADLARLAPAVLFSAAIPYQGGEHHQNERWQSYWAALFARQGLYPHDVVRPAVWTDPEVEPWYAQNTLLYTGDPGPSVTLDLVHPRHYLSALRARTARRRFERLPVRARGRALRLLEH
jgi:SAM-dependent methyltransferase